MSGFAGQWLVGEIYGFQQLIAKTTHHYVALQQKLNQRKLGQEISLFY